MFRNDIILLFRNDIILMFRNDVILMFRNGVLLMFRNGVILMFRNGVILNIKLRNGFLFSKLKIFNYNNSIRQNSLSADVQKYFFSITLAH